MTLVSQAEFARLKDVSKQAVTNWKAEGRITFVGGKIDVEATEATIVPNSGSRTKRKKPVRQVDAADRQLDAVERQPAAADRQVDDPLGEVAGPPPFVAGCGSPPSPPLGPWTAPTTINTGTGLPAEVDLWTCQIETGATDMAILLLRQSYPMTEVRHVVDLWVTKQRQDVCTILDDELEPPFGCERWSAHRCFTRPWLEEGGDTWADLVNQAHATRPLPAAVIHGAVPSRAG